MLISIGTGGAQPHRALPRPQDWQFVFHDEGKPLDERSVLRYQLRPIVKQLGVYFVGFGWHSFRRTHLTVLSEVGATAFETRDQAGHGKIETTMTYVKPALERRAKAVEKLAERLIRERSAGRKHRCSGLG